MSFLSEEYVLIDKAGDMHRGVLSKASQDVIKDKMNTLIGKDETFTTPTVDSQWRQSGVNAEKADLRQKVDEL